MQENWDGYTGDGQGNQRFGGKVVPENTHFFLAIWSGASWRRKNDLDTQNLGYEQEVPVDGSGQASNPGFGHLGWRGGDGWCTLLIHLQILSIVLVLHLYIHLK